MVGADLAAINDCVSGTWLQEFDNAFADIKLLDPVEKMEEATCMDHGDLAA